jgi:hypothetical protein
MFFCCCYGGTNQDLCVAGLLDEYAGLSKLLQPQPGTVSVIEAVPMLTVYSCLARLYRKQIVYLWML